MKTSGWETRLREYVESVRHEGFMPGTHDCALFVAGAVLAMTEEDPAAAFRGQYDTFDAGLVLVQQAGYIDHVDMLKSLYQKVPVAMAQFGDIAVVPVDDNPLMALGIVSGPNIFVLRETSLGWVDLLDAKMAFRV